MPFTPILPAVLPVVAELGGRALVDEDGAAAALSEACSGSAAPLGELVVWVWTFDSPMEQVLLVDHPGFDRLLPPGGRVERGEHPPTRPVGSCSKRRDCSPSSATRPRR